MKILKNAEYLLDLLKDKKYDILKKELLEFYPADIAIFINYLPPKQQKFIFSILKVEVASEVLSEVNYETRINLINSFTSGELAKLLDEMNTDEAADIVSEIKDSGFQEKVLEEINLEEKENIKNLLRYREDSAGGLMQTEVISVYELRRRDDFIDYIRKNYNEMENIRIVYVIDKDNKLIGNLDLIKLFLAKENVLIKNIMSKDLIFVNVDTDQEEVAHIFRKYDILSLPVVDKNNILLGRITVDDVIDVIDEEASEDAYKLVGLENEDKVFISPLSSAKKRIPWLILNLFTAFLVSSVVGIFEGTIDRLSFLAVLMPIVAGLGGNSGTQTLTIITRGLALGELNIHNTYKAVLKEISVGLINGVFIGFIAMLVAYFFKRNLLLGVVLGCSMIANMIIAGLVGSLVPLTLKKLKIDPALASGTFITMLTDMGGFASFLGLATILV